MDEQPTGPASAGFDKMRNMLARAAEVRADQERHLYDILEEVRERLAPLESFAAEGKGRIPTLHEHVATVQRRIGELPDRTEISVIAERLDEALARIDAQDSVLASVITAMDNLGQRMGKPLDALEARMDGVAGRFEGVAGRLDGLDDRLTHLHGRLDDLDHTLARAQTSLDAIPGTLDIGAVHGRLDELSGGVHKRFDEELGTVHGRLEEFGGRFEELVARPAVDPTESLTGLADRLEKIAGRMDAVEEGFRTGLTGLSGTVDRGVEKLTEAVSERPDREEVTRTLRDSQAESERRVTRQLDNALAAFAEIMLGRSVKGAVSRAGGRMAGKKSLDDDLDGDE